MTHPTPPDDGGYILPERPLDPVPDDGLWMGTTPIRGSGDRNPPPPAGPAHDEPQPKHKRRRRIFLVAAMLVLFGIGVAIGSAGGTNDAPQLASAQQSVKSQSATIAGQKATISQMQASVTKAENAAKTAVAAANAAAKAKYKARLSAAASTLSAARSQATSILAGAHRTQRRVNRLLGNILQSRIGGSAVYVVGKQMAPGLWHTSGSQDGSSCYYATLNSTDTSNIGDNNNFTGPETVQVSSYAFQTDGSCVWVKAG